MMKLRLLSSAAALLIAGCSTLAPPGREAVEGVPRYQHVIVIVDENKDYSEILDPAAAPNIAGLARTYGNAARFYAEVHPSEANYVRFWAGIPSASMTTTATIAAPAIRASCATALRRQAIRTIRCTHPTSAISFWPKA